MTTQDAPNPQNFETSPQEETALPPRSQPSPSPLPAGTGRRRPALLTLTLGIVALLGGSVLFLSGYSLGARTATTPGTPPGAAEVFIPFWDTYHAITSQFVGPVDRHQLVEGAIDGMIRSLGDPFSAYMNSEDFRRSLQGISGQFEGVGATIGTAKLDGSPSSCTALGPDCRMVVVEPLAGTPAERAGLKAGDVIIAIDGQSVDGQSIDEARARLRGKKGTPVILRIERVGVDAFDLTIVRDVIQQREVIAREMADGVVGYIRLTGFSDFAARELKGVLAEDVRLGKKRIILDLRDNLGGLVTAASSVASEFIDSGPIFWEENAAGEQTSVLAIAGGAATDRSIQVIVLMNGGSASASELVAGALQDTGRARIVGQQSYGKGTIQAWQTLSDDTGGYRLTVAKWLTPTKRWIHQLGITPDVPVEVPARTPVGQDPVLDRALELLAGSSTIPAAPARAA